MMRVFDMIASAAKERDINIPLITRGKANKSIWLSCFFGTKRQSSHADMPRWAPAIDPPQIPREIFISSELICRMISFASVRPTNAPIHETDHRRENVPYQAVCSREKWLLRFDSPSKKFSLLRGPLAGVFCKRGLGRRPHCHCVDCSKPATIRKRIAWIHNLFLFQFAAACKTDRIVHH